MKNLHTIHILLMLAISTTLVGQKLPRQLLKGVQIESMTRDLAVLTSDSLEGRNTGEPGAEKAARYIESRYQKMGLKPYDGQSYRQRFDLWKTSWQPVRLSVRGQIIADSLITYLGRVPQNDMINRDLVYVGDAGDSLLSGIDLTDKIALVAMSDMKVSYRLKSKLEAAGAWGIFAFNPSSPSQYMQIRTNYLKYLNALNASSVRPETATSGSRFYILSNEAVMLLTGWSSLQLTSCEGREELPDSFAVPVQLQTAMSVDPVPAWNIIGVIPGKGVDKQTIALTAHYDHVGRDQNGEICRGADDNASGVAAILQVADVMTRKGKQPYHDIMVVAFSGEEIGLIGSAYFTNHPPVERFLANVNIDMIGRQDTLGHDNYVYILGADKTPWLDSLHRSINEQTVNLVLDGHYAHETGSSSLMNRSDHFHFYRQDIPVIAFFSGLHGDYHTPRDTMDKLDLELMAKRIRLVLGTVYQMAVQPDLSSH